MRAEELMIGDWYANSDGDKCRVIKNFGTEVWGEGEDVSDSTDNPQPIRLTSKMLEKNGFERKGGISYHKSIAGLIIHHWNDELCFLNYSKKNIPPIMIPFHYTHELQHALKTCGLWELAQNFKV